MGKTAHSMYSTLDEGSGAQRTIHERESVFSWAHGGWFSRLQNPFKSDHSRACTDGIGWCAL